MPAPVLFDLDGTVADTAPDLAHALNRLRIEHELSALEFSVLRPLVSAGAAAMLRFAFEIDEHHPRFRLLRERFLALYSENICLHTCLFPGMDAVLDFLDTRHIRWGIVTNKPGWLTIPLLDRMDLARRAACIVSGDSLPVCKPRPEPLLHACSMMGCTPEHAIYIGDASTDIEAGLNAGMTTGVAHYGYLETGAKPHTWGAHFIFEQPADILKWLQTR